MFYNPRDWYWINPDNGDIYSSKAQALVAIDNTDYVTWKSMGLMPTPWPKDDSNNRTVAALNAVLTEWGLTSGL